MPARRRIHTKLIVFVGLIVTIGFSAILAFVLMQSREREREQAAQAAANVAATISSDIERNLELYDLSLQAVIDGLKLPDLWQMSPEMRQLILFDRAATAKDMGSIFVLDPQGNLVLDSRTTNPRPQNYRDSDFFVVQQGKPIEELYVSSPFQDADGQYLIAISRPIAAADGSFAGAVVGTLRVHYFQTLIDRVKLRSEDSLTVVRRDGALVMRSPLRNVVIGQSLARLPLFHKIVTYLSGTAEDIAGIDGVRRLYVYRAVGEYPLIVTYGLSLEQVYESWRSKAWIIGLCMLMLGATNVALIGFVAHAMKRQREAEHNLAVSATTDGLTRLCNRRRLDEIFEQEWLRAMRAQRPIAVLMIDADNFKAYNDQFGHPAGDTALIALARCIEGPVRAESGFVARYGGEEFLAVLSGVHVEEAAMVAAHIHTSVHTLRFDQQGRPDSTPTVSIGVAAMDPREGLEPRDLIRAADTALYQAKRNGRDRTEVYLPASVRASDHGRAAA